MKNIRIVGLTLVAVFALSAFAVSSAFASGELLLAGAKMGAGQEIPIEISGELLFEDSGAATSPSVICSGIFDGITVGPTLLYISELLTLAKVAEGNLVLCKKEKTCEGESIDFEALNFPWHGELELMEVSGKSIYLVILLAETGHTPEYNIDCVVPLLGLQEDSCSGESSARINNTGEGFLGYFNKLALSEPFGAESKNANCSIGGTEKGELNSNPETEAGGAAVTSTSGALTVSE
jgi:hypothetical protein